jgi:toxin ParE1/3/4
VVQQLITAVDRLERFPLSGRQVPEAESEDVREVICQHYRIIYWVIGSDRIDILGVVHSRRDLGDPDNQPWDTH